METKNFEYTRKNGHLVKISVYLEDNGIINKIDLYEKTRNRFGQDVTVPFGEGHFVAGVDFNKGSSDQIKNYIDKMVGGKTPEPKVKRPMYTTVTQLGEELDSIEKDWKKPIALKK